MRISTDWEELLRELVKHQVRFLVVGGIAVGVHGHVRYTKDLDLWIEPSHDNAGNVVAALTSFFGSDVGFRTEQFSRPQLLTKVGKEPFRVDFITSVSGLEFGTAYDNKVFFKLGTVEVPFISLDDLVITKQEAGRPQDLADASILKNRQQEK